MTRLQTLVLAGCILFAGLGYLAVGKPGMAGQPIAERMDALDEKIRTAPETLTPAEALSRLEVTVRERPDDPQPHYLIGNMLRSQQRLDDAMRAYQSALRRDPDHVGALVALGDVLLEVRGDGQVTPDATRVFARAYELDSNQAEAGFLAGLGAWQAGERDKAQLAWDIVLRRLPDNDPRADGLEEMIARIKAQEE